MDAKLKQLFDAATPRQAWDIMDELMQAATDNPGYWMIEVSTAINLAAQNEVQAEQNLRAARNAAWELEADGQHTAQQVLEAKGRAFDCDTQWVRWNSIRSELEDMQLLTTATGAPL